MFVVPATVTLAAGLRKGLVRNLTFHDFVELAAVKEFRRVVTSCDFFRFSGPLRHQLPQFFIFFCFFIVLSDTAHSRAVSGTIGDIK